MEAVTVSQIVVSVIVAATVAHVIWRLRLFVG
jgi:hypothetical protein